MKNFFLGCAALALAAAPTIAQEVTVQQTEIMTTPSVEKIEINEDGSLTGKVYAKVASEEIPVDAKVTLAKNGVVIEAVQTENGSFSFANIAPGVYTLSGSAVGFTGAQTYDVGPYTGAGSTFSLDLQNTNNLVQQAPQSFQASPIYNTPASATTTYGPATTYGSGGGGVSSGGGFGGGRLLGRRFGRRGLLRAGLIGGVVAIAVEDDDVSADQ